MVTSQTPQHTRPVPAQFLFARVTVLVFNIFAISQFLLYFSPNFQTSEFLETTPVRDSPKFQNHPLPYMADVLSI